MKKQNKIIVGGLAAFAVVVIAFLAPSTSSLQGRLVFSSDPSISRAEFAKSLAIAAHIAPAPCDEYRDVEFEDSGYICALFDQGIVGGYADGSFGPQRNVFRAEGARMIERAFNVQYDCPLPGLYKDNVIEGAWYFETVNKLGALSIFSTETPIGYAFRPNDYLTRTAASKWFSQVGNL